MASHRPLRVPTPWVRGAVGAVALMAILEIVTRAELVTPSYLPPASEIIGETFGLLGDGLFWDALWGTMKATLYGLFRAAVVAVPVGVMVGLFRWVRIAAMTIVELLRPLPSVALIPLAIIVYGRGLEMKLFLITFACLWPILFNTVSGMQSVDPVATDTARTFGLGRVATALRVQLRSAAPFIFTGVKIAASIALILCVSAELISGGARGGGIGIELSAAREVGNLKLSYAYTIMSGVIGLVLNTIFVAIERRLFAWNIEVSE